MTEIIDQVSQSLAKENITEQKLSQLEKDYAALAIKPITNDEELEVARLAKADLRTTRTTADKICKAGREEAILIQRLWIDKGKSIISRVEAIEKPLDENIDAYKAIAIERQRKEEAEKKLPMRTKLLEWAGIISTPDEFQFLSDTEFLEFFNTKAEEKKVAEQAQKDKEANDKLIEEWKRKAAEDALKNAYKDLRDKSMLALWFKKSDVSQKFIFEIFNVGVYVAEFSTVYDCTDAEFDVYYNTYVKAVDSIKKEDADRKQAAMQEKANADALAKIEADKKIKADADEKAKLAEIKKKALLPDKQKLQEFVDSLKWDYPVVATEAGQAIVARAKYLIDTSKKDLQARINQL